MSSVVDARMGRGFVLGLCVALALGVGGCVGGAFDEDDGASERPLIDGQLTSERNEIGSIGGCTATLIRPNIAITAAHCLGYATRQNPGRYTTFSVETGNGWDSYNVKRYVSFSSQLGERDVCLLQLSESIPASVATPSRVADRGPEQGEDVTIFGYGCTSRRNQRSGGDKRKATFPYGQFSSHLCPGDSGGPYVKGLNGPVFGINSGYYTGNGEDIFGFPYTIKTELEAQIRAWEELDGAPVQRREINVTNNSGRRVFVKCAGDDSATCSWWNLLEPGQSTWLAAPDNNLMVDNDDFGGTWDWTEATAPNGDSVTVHDNPDNPFYPPGTEPEEDPAPAPDPDASPNPEEDPAPNPEEDPTPDPEPDFVEPDQQPDDNNDPQNPPDDNGGVPDPGPNPNDDGAWVDEGEQGQAWIDDEGDAWLDEAPAIEDRATCTVAGTTHDEGQSPLGWIAVTLIGAAVLVRRRR